MTNILSPLLEECGATKPQRWSLVVIALSLRAFDLHARDSEHYSSLIRKLKDIQAGATEDEDVSAQLWTLAAWAKDTFPQVSLSLHFLTLALNMSQLIGAPTAQGGPATNRDPSLGADRSLRTEPAVDRG